MDVQEHERHCITSKDCINDKLTSSDFEKGDWKVSADVVFDGG